MKYVYSLLIGGALGLGSVFIHSSFVPYGLVLSLASTVAGIWSIGRMWGGRTYKSLAAIAWLFVIVRAAIGVSLLNLGVLCLVLAVLLPA